MFKVLGTIKNSDPDSKFYFFIVAHILILLGYSLNLGFLSHQAQLWFLFFGWIILLSAFFEKSPIQFIGGSVVNWLLVANLCGFILFYFLDGGIYIVSHQLKTHLVLLKFVSLILFLLYFVKLNFRGDNFFSYILVHFSKFKFIYLVVLAVVLRLSIIFASPMPHIDVYWLLKGAAYDLFSGQNPYAGDYLNVYSPAECLSIYSDPDCNNDNYSYLPASLIITSLFTVLFSDPRVAYVFSFLGIAIIIYLLLKDKFKSSEVKELGTLLWLYLPLSLFVLEQAWVDQLSLFFLYLFAFFLVKKFKALPYIVLGIFFSTKQTMILFLPFLLRLKDFNWRKIVLVVMAGFIIVAPFLIWGFNDFIYDTVFDQLLNKEGVHSLSLKSLVKINLPDTEIYFGLSMALIFMLFVCLMIKTPRDLISVLQAGVIFSLMFFLLERGFTNYYFTISGVLILLIILSLTHGTKDHEDKFIDPTTKL